MKKIERRVPEKIDVGLSVNFDRFPNFAGVCIFHEFPVIKKNCLLTLVKDFLKSSSSSVDEDENNDVLNYILGMCTKYF